MEEIKIFATKGNTPIAEADLISSAYFSLKATNTRTYDKAIDAAFFCLIFQS